MQSDYIMCMQSPYHITLKLRDFRELTKYTLSAIELKWEKVSVPCNVRSLLSGYSLYVVCCLVIACMYSAVWL